MSSADSGDQADRPKLEQADFAVGDLVVDREDSPTERDPAVVVNLPPVAAADWAAYETYDGEQRTVAEDNPEYDADAEVVVVAFRADLEAWRVDWRPDEPLPVAEAPDDMLYAFPPGRLRTLGEYEPDDADDDTEAEDDHDGEAQAPAPDADLEDADDGPVLRDQLDAIAAAAEELNVDSVAVDTFREAVVVEKLGHRFTIATDGTVDAEDPLADRLEAAVASEVER